MAISREQILRQNQRDKEYFASLSALVQDALGAQATMALNARYGVCVISDASVEAAIRKNIERGICTVEVD